MPLNLAPLKEKCEYLIFFQNVLRNGKQKSFLYIFAHLSEVTVIAGYLSSVVFFCPSSVLIDLVSIPHVTFK